MNTETFPTKAICSSIIKISKENYMPVCDLIKTSMASNSVVSKHPPNASRVKYLIPDSQYSFY